MLGTCKHT